MSVLTARATSSSSLVTGRARVLGMWVMGGATNGSVVLKDVDTNGTARITIDVPGITTTGTTFAGYIPFPDTGVSFDTAVFAVLTTAAGVTIFYESMKSA